MLYIEIDDDDGNDILNYSRTTESYSVPTDHDSDETVVTVMRMISKVIK